MDLIWYLFLVPVVAGVIVVMVQFHRVAQSGEQQRLKDSGCCLECGYDMHGNESGVCPECGSRYAL